MKTIHQFTMNRQFFKIILDLVHTRYQIPGLLGDLFGNVFGCSYILVSRRQGIVSYKQSSTS